VRGDSLRDFYAKTLAVLGLGLLAGAGAIVDYWPVGEEVPSVPAVAGLESPRLALPQNLTAEIPAPAPQIALPRPAPIQVMAELFNGIPANATATDAVVLTPMPVPEDFLTVDSTLPEIVLVEAAELEPPPLNGAPIAEQHRVFSDAVRELASGCRPRACS
jgi:hypothetical protein